MSAPARFAAKMTAGIFTNPVAGIRLPDRDYLVGEYLLGGTQAESVMNRAIPANVMTVQGTPTYNANSVLVRSHVTAGYGFLTNFIPHLEHTLIVVRKNASVVGTSPKVVGNASGGGGLFGARQFGSNNYMSMGENAANQGANRAVPPAGQIYFEAGVHSLRNPQLLTGGFGTLYYYSGGTQQAAVSADLGIINRISWTQYCIGSTSLTDSTATNNLEVFFAAIYNKPLTPAGIDAAHDAIVAYYATLGVTVV